MRSFPFFADLSEKHGGPESNTKASWAMKFFSVILASYQEILSHPLSSQWTDCRERHITAALPYGGWAS